MAGTDREARLKAALRENLKRRKAQARSRTAPLTERRPEPSGPASATTAVGSIVPLTESRPEPQPGLDRDPDTIPGSERPDPANPRSD